MSTDRDVRHHDVLVVGGGNAGISLAARLVRDGAPDVAIVSDSAVHAYRPLLNYVGGGQAAMADLERSMRQVLPTGCAWIQDTVVGVEPGSSTVRTRSGQVLGFDTLVLAPGLEEDWEATPGLRAAYDVGWAASTYVTSAAPRVWPRVHGLRGGTVVFTVPPDPASCAPTALKPLFLACDHWRREGVLEDFDVHLVLPGAGPTGISRADDLVERHLDRAGVRVHRCAVVGAVEHRDQTVELETDAGTERIEDVAFAHVVPRARAPRWVTESGLAEPEHGLVDIDPRTLQHRTHPAIWSLGDAAAVQTIPSGGALRPQVEVLAHNLAAARHGGELSAYDGYTVVPVTVARHRTLLAEVDRSGRLVPSVPVVDLLRPRLSTWFADRYLLPQLYFRRILRGKV